MDQLLVFFAQNTLGALILAIGVYAVTRTWRNPPVVHVLWLLVLAKLVAPPLFGVDWQAAARWARPATPDRAVTNATNLHVPSDPPVSPKVSDELTPPHLLPSRSSSAEPGPARIPSAPASAAVTTKVQRSTAEQRAADVVASWPQMSTLLFWMWLAGTADFLTLATIRVARFYRRLRDTLPASERLQVMGQSIADRFGVRRQPDIRYVDSGGPLVYCFSRRPVILLPIDLSRQLDDEQASMILAHELAHVCRRDHWVRLFELIVSTLYWWNPLVWLVRRQLHAAEEQCCDAWVRWAFPGSPRRYAEVLLLAADATNFGGTVSPVLASSFLRRHSVKARIEMILNSRFAPRLSRRGKALVCLLALIALPLFVQSAKSHAQQNSDFARQAFL
jgi:bla regulator protein blaR1